MFIDFPDYQKIVYWLGIPYGVESLFRGRFLYVMDSDFNEEITDQNIINNVLRKHQLYGKNETKNAIL